MGFRAPSVDKPSWKAPISNRVWPDECDIPYAMRGMRIGPTANRDHDIGISHVVGDRTSLQFRGSVLCIRVDTLMDRSSSFRRMLS